MLNLSKKSELVPASPIRKLVPFSEEAKRKGVKVHHLNIGQPDIETPEIALSAIKNISSKVLEYTHSAGNESFRRGMAKYYQDLNLDVNFDDIIATNGGSEAILFTLMACVDAGCEVIVPEPFYANYNGFAAEAGVNIVPVVSTIEDNFALPAISEIEKKITEKTRAILLCNPNNPTGYLYTLEELEQLRDLSVKNDLFLIVDEVYREFCYDGNIHHSALKLEGASENVVVIDSLSKRYSMCGIRLGVVVSKNKAFIDAILRMGQARLCPPLLAQIAGEAALATPKSYFEDVYNEYIERRNVTINALNEIEGVHAPMPMGAFYSIVKLPVDSADKFAQWILEEFSYNGETVMLAPASGFYATEGHGVDEVRIAYVLEKESLKAAVKCIEMALKEYNSK